MWGWLHQLAERPAWRRARPIIEELAADVVVTIFLMLCIFLSHSAARLLAIDKLPIGHGFEIGHIFTMLHGLNVVINGGYALLRLIKAHSAGHD